MTALAPANHHAFQTPCSGRRAGDILVNNLRLPALKTNYRELPNIRATTRLTGIDFRGWSMLTDGVPPAVDGENIAGWSAVARTPR